MVCADACILRHRDLSGVYILMQWMAVFCDYILPLKHIAKGVFFFLIYGQLQHWFRSLQHKNVRNVGCWLLWTCIFTNCLKRPLAFLKSIVLPHYQPLKRKHFNYFFSVDDNVLSFFRRNPSCDISDSLIKALSRCLHFHPQVFCEVRIRWRRTWRPQRTKAVKSRTGTLLRTSRTTSLLFGFRRWKMAAGIRDTCSSIRSPYNEGPTFKLETLNLTCS